MKISILLIFILINYSAAVNILGLMHVASPSYSIWNNILVKALAERGHNVTVIISNLPKNPKDMHKNVSYFSVEELYSDMSDETVEIKDLFELTAYEMALESYDYCTTNCETALKTKGFKDFMKTYDKNFKFDIILYDYTCGPCLLGLLDRFNYPPLVAVSPFPVPSYANSFTGGHFNPGYISFYSALLDPSESIVDRFYNNFLQYFELYIQRFLFYPNLDKILRKYNFPENMKSVSELEKYVTISLINYHPSVTSAEPVPPNVIEVGGLQLIDSKPLPKDLENFIKSSKIGAIFFSLGTNVRPEDLKDEVVDIFITVIKKFSQYNFMWKFDESRIKTEIPKNLLIRKYFPQPDILAHPKTVAFITHCGGLSTQESIYYAVPMIGMPLFADQRRNLRHAEQQGIAVHIDIVTATTEKVENAIKEILENKKYMENIKLLSKRFRDRPQKPLDTAIWWIEYILRNPNPDHLKPKSLYMNFFAAHSLDFYFVVVTTFNVIIFAILGIIWKCCCRKDKKDVKKKLKTK